MARKRRLLSVGAAVVTTAALAASLAGNAVAGIGPAGFAYYAKQGIQREIDAVYGKGNSPYTVTCTEAPNYSTLSDTVTCKIREK